MYIETNQQTEERLLIIEIIENITGVPRELWETKRTKNKDEVMIRHIYINLLHSTKLFTLMGIARCVGLKNHSTILQSLEISNSWSTDTEAYSKRKLLNQIKQEYEQRNS